MKLRLSPRGRKWLIIPPVLLGAGIFAVLMFNTRQPERKPPQEAVRVLRVIAAPQVDVIPRVLGYGTAAPAQVWRAVAEVEGRVVEVHAELKPGSILKADDLVLRIDPREYELTVSQLEAEIAEVEARLAELRTQGENDRALLAIEQASLELAERELNRLRDLVQRDASTLREVEDEERTVLAQRQKVQTLKNSISLLPQQRAALQASLALRKARLEQTKLDLQKTVIRTPFACRLGKVRIEPGQFLKTGEVLFEADGIEVAEVDVQVSIDRGRALFRGKNYEKLGGVPDMATLREMFAVDATVRMRVGDFSAEWEARFARIREQLDPQTRTVGVVVAVDKPYEQAIPGVRPPLLKGTFCEVELRGTPLPGRVVIPRAALHTGHVYVVGGDSRLRERQVQVLFAQSDFICLDGGLEPGETIVVSDPTPAIEGMLVEPVPDESLRNALIVQAQGGTVVR